MGALRKWAKAMKGFQAGAPDGLGESQAVGEYFLRQNPEEYFRLAKGPGRDLQEIQQLYDVELSRLPPVKMGNGQMSPSMISAKPKGADWMDNHDASIYDLAEYMKLHKGETDKVDLDMLHYLPRDTPVYNIGSNNTFPGAGNGAQTYPALYDYLSGGKGLTNVTNMLTEINTIRKPMHTADAIMRNPRLSSLIIPSQAMIEGAGVTPLQYAAGDLPRQVGALQLSGMAKARDRLADLIAYPPDDPWPEEMVSWLSRMGPNTPVEEFEDYGRRFGKISGPYGIGANTLRRMNIVDAILSGRENELPPEMARGLGYKQGGLARHHECSCQKW